MKSIVLLLGLLLAGGTVPSLSAAKLGDPAKPLAIKEWVKGKAANVLDGKNIYVVEFWATWCGPCKRSIPHLSEMQSKFKDKGVVFIGISDEAPAKVKPFVERMGEKMDYVVACDDSRKSNAAYMRAYGQGGIPHAFVVSKKHQVVWHGHPMAGLEEALEEMVAGKFDLQAALKKESAKSALADYQKLAAQGDAKAKAMGRQLLAEAGNNAQALIDFAFGIVANIRNPHKDFALAEEALTRAEKLVKGTDHRILGTRSIALFESGKQTEGLAMARQALALAKSDVDQAKYKNFIRVMEMRMKKP